MEISEICEKWNTQGLRALSEEELVLLRDNLHQQEHKNDIMLEIQRRNAKATARWQKWGVLISASLAVIALIISILAYLKP